MPAATSTFSPEVFLSTLALIGVVIVVSALLSGLVEKSGLPQVAAFLALGAAIGPFGLGLLQIELHSPILRVVGTLSLVLVLFTDALSLNIKEVQKNRLLSTLVLGPGTLLSALVIAGLSWYILKLSPAAALVLGAALASTDPVMLRSLIKRPGVNRSVSLPLRLEGGMNDAVLLPLVLVGMTFLRSDTVTSAQEWVRLGMNVLILSPAAGIIVGLGAVSMLELLRRRVGVRRDYESIYSLGVAFAAFAAAEAIHGSGFLAAFAAGLTISALDVELCDCFLEYGETTAEMALMFTFVLFGVSVIWRGFSILNWATFGFVIAVFLARPLVFIPALLPAKLSGRNRMLIAWFGPRGLSSLLLVLLAVFNGTPGSEYLLTVCCLVVLFSVVLHGLSPIVLIRDTAPVVSPGGTAEKFQSSTAEPSAKPAAFRVLPPDVLPQSADPTASSGNDTAAADESPHPEYITVGEVNLLRNEGEQVIVVDARSERTYQESDELIPGSVRVEPEQSVRSATAQAVPKTAVLAVLCA
jgi:sodium/hydrogen antiporter